MGHSKRFIFFLAVFLVTSCASKTPQRDNAYNNGNWYAEKVKKYASEWLTQLESDIPTEPVCRLGIVFESNLIVSVVSPSARKAGFLVGDCLNAIDGEYLLSEEDVFQNINRKRAGEHVMVGVVRGNETIEIEAMCKDVRKLHLLDMKLVKAAANGEWDKCISLSYKTEKENGKTSEYSYARLCCSEAKRLISEREPTEKDAELHYEHFSRVISESSFDPEALLDIRNDLNKGISWLEYQGFHKLAEDLIAQWETAVNSEVPNCIPCEDKRMIFFVPTHASME